MNNHKHDNYHKSYTPAFKAEIVQELLKEEQTLTHIASKNEVQPNQLRWWEDAALIVNARAVRR